MSDNTSDQGLYENKTDEQKMWISKNEICKSVYDDENKCNVDGTGCKWKYYNSYVNEKNEIVTQPAYCSNLELYPNN